MATRAFHNYSYRSDPAPSSVSVPAAVRAHLEERFRPAGERLRALLDWPTAWGQADPDHPPRPERSGRPATVPSPSPTPPIPDVTVDAAGPGPFAFFMGAGRSGTTLVEAIFDSHPDLAVAHEIRFVSHLGRRRRRYERAGGFATDRFLSDVLSYPSVSHLQLSADELHRALASGSPPSSYADAVRRIFSAFAARTGKTRYGDKTPSYVLAVPLIAELFPEARFVHVIRDGRDAVLAHLDRGTGLDNLTGNAFHWRSMVRHARRAGFALGPTRYVELRYEALLEDPEAAIRPACKLLDLPFDEKMLHYYERADEIVGPMHEPERFAHLYLPPTKGLRDWRNQMPPEHVAVFEAIAGDLLEELGYERARPSPRAGRARVARAWLDWQHQRVVYVTRELQRMARKRRRRLRHRRAGARPLAGHRSEPT